MDLDKTTIQRKTKLTDAVYEKIFLIKYRSNIIYILSYIIYLCSLAIRIKNCMSYSYEIMH